MSGTHVPEEVSSQLGYTHHENSVPNAPIQKDGLSGVDSGSLHEIQVTETDRTDETDVDLHIKETMEIMAEGMSQMEVVNPEVLRVTQACRAFDHFAAALRSGTSGNQRDFYHKSRKSHKISTFWSHSWHGGHRKENQHAHHFLQRHCGGVLGYHQWCCGNAPLPFWSTARL